MFLNCVPNAIATRLGKSLEAVRKKIGRFGLEVVDLEGLRTTTSLKTLEELPSGACVFPDSLYRLQYVQIAPSSIVIHIPSRQPHDKRKIGVRACQNTLLRMLFISERLIIHRPNKTRSTT